MKLQMILTDGRELTYHVYNADAAMAIMRGMDDDKVDVAALIDTNTSASWILKY